MDDETPSHIVLGDVVKLTVETAPVTGGFRAWSSQWEGVEGFGATATGAVHQLQSELEKLLARNIAPRHYVSP